MNRKTPRTNLADKYVTYKADLSGNKFPVRWVYESFAEDLETDLIAAQERIKELEQLFIDKECNCHAHSQNECGCSGT